MTDDNIISKADDDLLKKWVMIGHHFFSKTEFMTDNEISEIKIPCEYGAILIELEEENFRMSQNEDRLSEIVIYNHIDRTDAYRLAGMLIAWASTKHLHEKS